MEKKSPYLQKLPISLKDLPPILPSTITTTSFKVNQSTKHREFAEEDFDFFDKTGRGYSIAEDASCRPTKHIDPDTVKTNTKKKKKKKKSKSRNVISTWQSFPINEGSLKKVSAKAILYEICNANHWNPPSFKCCQEEGPCHLKTFTYKVVVEIKGAEDVVLECFGGPQPRKKAAEEHAAAGALCYLKHVGYYS